MFSNIRFFLFSIFLLLSGHSNASFTGYKIYSCGSVIDAQFTLDFNYLSLDLESIVGNEYLDNLETGLLNENPGIYSTYRRTDTAIGYQARYERAGKFYRVAPDRVEGFSKTVPHIYRIAKADQLDDDIEMKWVMTQSKWGIALLISESLDRIIVCKDQKSQIDNFSDFFIRLEEVLESKIISEGGELELDEVFVKTKNQFRAFSQSDSEILEALNKLESILHNPDYKFKVMSSAVAGMTIWTLLKNPKILSGLALRRFNPAVAIIPPNILNKFFGSKKNILILPSSDNISDEDLNKFFRLAKKDQIQMLRSNPKMFDYLLKIRKSLLEQEQWILINKGLLT